MLALCTQTVASAIVIGDKNATEILSWKKHKPVFIGLFSQWCTHCLEFKPVWKRIDKFFADDPNVTIATVSCDFDRELCANFSGTGTPRLFFATRDVSHAHMYEGPRTFAEIKNYIQKKTQPPLINIDNTSQLNTLLAQNINSSIFLIQDLGNNRLLRLITKEAEKYEDAQCLFFRLTFKLFPEDQPQVKYLFPKTNQNSTLLLKKLFSRRTLSNFVLHHAYPSYVEFSSTFHKYLSQVNKPFLVLDDGKKDFEKKLIQYTVDFPDGMKSTSVNCYTSYKFCKSIQLPMENKASIGMVNSYRRTYYVYNGPMKRESISQWVNSVWEGKEKELGPGVGLHGWYLRNIQANLKDPWWWAYVAMSVFAIMLVFYLIRLVISLARVPKIKPE